MTPVVCMVQVFKDWYLGHIDELFIVDNRPGPQGWDPLPVAEVFPNQAQYDRHIADMWDRQRRERAAYEAAARFGRRDAGQKAVVALIPRASDAIARSKTRGNGVQAAHARVQKRFETLPRHQLRQLLPRHQLRHD